MVHTRNIKCKTYIQQFRYCFLYFLNVFVILVCVVYYTNNLKK